MNMSSDPSSEENQVALKVAGDLGNFQIVEDEQEETESEDEDSESETVNTLAKLPQELVQPSSQPIFGSVQVNRSENVQFGNNIYFNGPVTIKQVVGNKEHDNPGYVHTEDDVLDTNTAVPPPSQNFDVKKQQPQTKPFRLKLWLKLTFSAVGIVIIGGISAIVFVTLVYNYHDNTDISNYNEDNSTSCLIKVEGIFYEYSYLKSGVVFLLSLVLLTCIIWFYKLLTTDMSTNVTPVISVNAEMKKCEYNVEEDPLLIAPTHLRIVSRTDWLAQPVEKPLDKITLPVPWVIIQHTATESCFTQSECVLSVRLIQMFHVESRGWFDIGYNFLVAGDGSAYAGRGWEFQGAHTLGYNKYSMGIAFIGTFNNEPPPKKQLDACKKLIQRGVELGKIAKDYKLFAHRQLASTLSPGEKLFEILKEWPHFVNNVTDIDELIPGY